MAKWIRTQFHRLPLFWRLQFMGWGGFMIYAYFSRASFWNDRLLALVLTLVLEPISLVISMGLRSAYTRLGFRSFTAATIVAVIIFSGLGACIQIVNSEVVYRVLTGLGMITAKAEPRYAARIIFHWLIFGSWSIAYLGLKAEFSARTERQQREAAAAAAQRAELQMLRLQLNPHFMFNSLNNIASEIPEEPDRALEMTHQLAEYLRYSMDHRGDLIVPLAYEITGMKTYLAIEQGRFGERLHVAIEEEAGTRGVKVPSFLLQPLVENAVKHGLNTSEPPWELEVKVGMEKGRLRISVTNNGTLDKKWKSRDLVGTGIANLERRLALHYPGRHQFSLWQQGPRVVADMTLEGEPCQV